MKEKPIITMLEQLRWSAKSENFNDTILENVDIIMFTTIIDEAVKQLKEQEK